MLKDGKHNTSTPFMSDLEADLGEPCFFSPQ